MLVDPKLLVLKGLHRGEQHSCCEHHIAVRFLGLHSSIVNAMEYSIHLRTQDALTIVSAVYARHPERLASDKSNATVLCLSHPTL